MGFDISEFVLAKSDQLNADDLTGAPRRIKITGTKKGNKESPVIINYEGDSGRPFKPCKTVLRILQKAWGSNTGNWEGKEALLFCDPTVVYAGKEVGGIRVKALSDIPSQIRAMLAKTRGKKVEHIIDVLEPLELKQFPDEAFTKMLDQFKAAIENGERTPEQIINNLSAKGVLTDQQKETIRNMNESESHLVIEEDESGFFGEGE